MDVDQRCFMTDQMMFFDEIVRQVFNELLIADIDQYSHQFVDSFTSQPCIFQLVGGAVDAFQPISDQVLVLLGRDVFHFGMHEVEPVLKHGRFSEDQVFLVGREPVFNPLQAPEPQQFDGTRIIGQPGRNVFGPLFTDHFQV